MAKQFPFLHLKGFIDQRMGRLGFGGAGSNNAYVSVTTKIGFGVFKNARSAKTG